MSSGQRARTPANFPRMKDRAIGRRAKKAQHRDFGDAIIRVAAILNGFADAVVSAFTGIDWAPLGRLADNLAASIEPAAIFALPNPEQAVIDAINGLEADEIGERVRWQLEEGMKRGDHLLYPVATTTAQRFRPVDPDNLRRGILVIDPPLDANVDPASWQPIGEIAGSER